MHVVTGKVPIILKEALMLLKPLNGMRFYKPDILPGGHSLLSSQYISQSPVLPTMFWDMKNYL